MTDAYIASLGMISTPGATQAYNNCGHYCSAAFVAKLHNKTKTIDAYHQYLFTPLSITRIRRAISLVASQPADEAGTRIPTSRCYASQLSQSQRFVPDEYGSEQIESSKVAAGCRERRLTSRE